jgi:hypothetical protein
MPSLSAMWLYRTLRALALAASLLVLTPVLCAAPALRGVSLRCASSPRLPVGEWVCLQYTLENPDDQVAAVRLSLRAADRGRGVFGKTVVVGPHSQLSGREMVVAEGAASYVLSLFVGTDRIHHEEVLVTNAEATTQADLMILNDDPAFNVAGTFSEPALLRERVGLTSATARSLPEHWVAYGHTRLVVIASPRYRDLSAAQFNALVAYVERGGTALFANPDGTLAAAATPWAALLPVVPLRVRLTEALPELDAWGAALVDSMPAAQRPVRRPLAERDGFALLESTERGEGLTILRSGTMPLIRWRRCGLGRVGMVAVDPMHPRLAACGALVPLWNHILELAQPVAAIGNPENSSILPTVLAHLTGYRIPSADAVGALLYGYVAVLLVLLVGGATYRRNVLAWLAAATLGVLFTAGIFVWTFRQHAEHPVARAAIFDQCLGGGDYSTGQAVVSLFTKRDLRPTIRALAPSTTLRSLPSPARGRVREPLEAPLIVQREADLAGLPAITVPALKPRELVAQYERPLPAVEPLTVTLGQTGAVVREGTLPARLGTRHARAFLLLAGGLVPLRRDGLQLVELETGRRLLDTDPFLTDLARYLSEGSLPRPAVLVLQPWDDIGGKALPLDVPEFVQDGCRMALLPVALECGAGRIAIPPEWVRLQLLRTPVPLWLRATMADQDPTQGIWCRCGCVPRWRTRTRRRARCCAAARLSRCSTWSCLPSWPTCVSMR